MEKTVLFVGKELPAAKDFATGFKNKNRTSFIVDRNSVLWNKSSPISARTLVLQSADNSQDSFDAVLYFDEKALIEKFTKTDIQTCTQINDEFVLSYQYLTIEVIQFFKTHPGKIAFIYKELPKAAAIPCLFIKAAGAAFTGFAETVAMSTASDGIQTALVRTDGSNEEYQNDTALAEWLCSYFDALDQTKSQPNIKHCTTWIKPGSKPAAGFSIFR